IVSSRSQKRSERSSSSDSRVHGSALGRFTACVERLAEAARLPAACANDLFPSRDWREKLSNVGGTVFGQSACRMNYPLAFSRLRRVGRSAQPAASRIAEADETVCEEPVGVAFD